MPLSHHSTRGILVRDLCQICINDTPSWPAPPLPPHSPVTTAQPPAQPCSPSQRQQWPACTYGPERHRRQTHLQIRLRVSGLRQTHLQIGFRISGLRQTHACGETEADFGRLAADPLLQLLHHRQGNGPPATARAPGIQEGLQVHARRSWLAFPAPSSPPPPLYTHPARWCIATPALS